MYEDTNGVPRTGNPPRVIHVGLASGELANRVVVVGHHSRAELLTKFLKPQEPDAELFRHVSDRGFLTYTGQLNGTRISVVSIGMGLPMMDFFVREARAVVDGPMAVVRFGTCGTLQDWVQVGTLSVASEGSVLVQRNYDHFFRAAKQENGHKQQDEESAGASPYLISDLCPPDRELSDKVAASIKLKVGADSTVEGVNVTADSFYGAQGRADSRFNDANSDIIDEVLRRHPKAVTMEMETFQLLHLAQSCRPSGDLRAAAAVVNVANRRTGDVLGEDELRTAELNGGEAILSALATMPLA